jgi:hypothetical protein
MGFPIAPATQVNDRCIDRDYEVEVRDDRRRVGEVANVGAERIASL